MRVGVLTYLWTQFHVQQPPWTLVPSVEDSLHCLHFPLGWGCCLVDLVGQRLCRDLLAMK